MPETHILKQMIGQAIHLERRDGGQEHGHLVNVNRRSVWLVAEDVDYFVAIGDIAELRLAS